MNYLLFRESGRPLGLGGLLLSIEIFGHLYFFQFLHLNYKLLKLEKPLETFLCNPRRLQIYQTFSFLAVQHPTFPLFLSILISLLGKFSTMRTVSLFVSSHSRIERDRFFPYFLPDMASSLAGNLNLANQMIILRTLNPVQVL